MKLYGTLVDEIANLHQLYAPTAGFCPSPLIVNGDWIPTVVDTTTSKATKELPVVVAVGANYATGVGKLPTKVDAVHRTKAPWVEERLSGKIRCRDRVTTFLRACSTGKTKRHWNGLLPFDPDGTYSKDAAASLAPEPHFVMTNFSPWITTRDWSPIRSASLEDMFGILAAPSDRGGGLWGYFHQLKKCVGPGAIWIGHGNAEIYGLFRLLCHRMDIEQWYFDSNLSFPSHMISRKAPPLPP